jgi:hypothetical protein
MGHMAIDVGGTYRSAYKVYDASGVLTAPATKVFTVTLPDQTTATPSISTVVAGSYYADYVITQEGLHKFVWVTTGPATSKSDYDNAWNYRSVIGLQEMKDFLSQVSTAQDETIRFLMAYATEMAEKIVGTCVPKTFTNEHIPGYSREVIRLPHGPLLNKTNDISVASEIPNGPVWTNTTSPSLTMLNVYTTAAVVEPVNYTGFYMGPWKATYIAGRTIIPQAIIMAVKLIVYDLFSTQRGALPDPLSPNFDEMSMVEARIPPGYTMPPQALALLKRHSRPGFA